MDAVLNGAGAPARAGRREWIGLGVIALPCMLYSMDLTVLNLALPQLARDLKPTAGQMLWIIDIYGFMVAGFLMTMGALGDRLGRRRILLIGAAAFGVTSIFAAFAQTAEQLILARALLGISGATLAPSTLSLITSMFRHSQDRTFAISMWVMSFSFGAVVGPVAGGVLIEFFWWGSVFLIAVPVMALLLILGPKLLPEHRNPDATGVDFPSAMLSLIAVLSMIYGVKTWAEFGMGATVGFAIGIGLVLGVVFLRRQAGLADPLIDVRLFASKVFSVSLGINTFALFFLFGAFVLFAQYLQLVAGLTPLEAGLWSLPGAVAFTLASPFTSRLVAQFSAVSVMTAGLLISALGFLLLAVADSLELVVLSGVIQAVGFTPVVALTTGFIVGSAPVEKAGVASALSETGSELGGALGIASIGSLFTVIYRTSMVDVPMGDAPPTLVAAARSTLAGAVEVAGGMSSDMGDAMLAAARMAFMDALHITAILASVALAGLAILTYRVLRGHEPAQDGHG